MTLRHLVDLLVCLIVTITCVRAFVIEGYMISTGSMAPGLLGYHKRVVCPRCHTEFELGVAFDDESGGRITVKPSPDDPATCRCPNCGADKIELRHVPRNQGDQLLVHKNAFLLRQPDRWEVVVFLNPARAAEPFVKRVVGRPMERIRLQDGDVFINGHRAQKNLAQTLATQIVVHDDNHRPTDSEWRDRWETGRQWRRTPAGFETEISTDWSWVNYHHWLRSGGRHRTAALTPAGPLAAAHRAFSDGDGFPFVVRSRIEFDEEHSELVCRGVMPPALQAELLKASDDPEFQRAVRRLAAQSHFAPIGDAYGYNAQQHTVPVRDVGIELTLRSDRREGEFVVQLHAATGCFELAFDLRTGQTQLYSSGRNQPLCGGSFAPSLLSEGVSLGVRHVDQQILVSLNGELLLAPFVIPDTIEGVSERQKLAFAARNAAVSVTDVRIVRDIHYTPGRAKNGIDEEFQLGPEEFFVLGDNSPVSSDSRNWAEGAIHASQLIGKPILVHLPSSPKALKFGSDHYLIRIPEFSRIRYIR